MLLELNIKNFAIIKDLNVQFTRGLNIITGETGAGKSILIEALGIILGSRSNKDLIRTGENLAFLEAVFYIDNPKIIENKLKEYGIIVDDDGLLIISKQISKSGPSLSKINGKSVNLTMLSSITKKLVDIFGQHEHQSLLDVSNHKLILDSFGDEKLFKVKNEILNNYRILKKQQDYLDSISINLMEKDREIDMLNFQIKEIDDANLDKEKDLNLEVEYKKLLNIDTIRKVFSDIFNSLNGNGYELVGIIETINNNSINLGKITNLDSGIEELYKRFNNIKFELEDINREFINFIDNIEFNENRLNEIESRLDLINKLKNKYGNTIEEILKFREDAKERLNKLLNQDKEIADIQKRINEISIKLNNDSSELTELRKNISAKLEKEIQKELEELNMSQVKFKVDFKKHEKFSSDGIDRIEFLISTNIGEDLKSLSKIASGGEMSRIMLAFKSILADYDFIETMIFDEIDTGISGRTAQIVGEKIYDISKKHQVICISHLPQITALADSHYLIDKETINNKTGSYIRKLNMSERVEELARLIGGVNLTKTTLKHASEMIQMTKNVK